MSTPMKCVAWLSEAANEISRKTIIGLKKFKNVDLIIRKN
jgi:hypothetical protein